MKRSIICKDYSVSGELFRLEYCVEKEMLVTTPQPEDLDKYYDFDAYISHTDSKKGWFDRLYQFVKSIALQNKLKLINSLDSKEKNLLDIGCGTGEFLKVAAEDAWVVDGIEPNTKARVLAEKKIGSKIPTSIFDISDEKHFDVISLWHVLEHVPELDASIEKIISLLKEEGSIVIAVPNYKSYDAKHYQEFWAAYDVPRHLWHFSQKSMEIIFSKYDFKVVSKKPMKFDSYYVSLLSEKYKTGYKNIFRAFWVGLRSNFKAKKDFEYSSIIYILKKHKNG